MREELKLLTRFQKDSEWFNSNFDELQCNYENRFIAIKDENVLDSAPDFQKLLRLLSRKRENLAFILIKFIHEKGTSVII